MSFSANRKPSIQYTKEYPFCYSPEFVTTTIRKLCDTSRNYFTILDFTLYGGTSSTPDTIKLYDFVRTEGRSRSTNLFLTYDGHKVLVHFHYGTDYHPNLYIPGKLKVCFPTF